MEFSSVTELEECWNESAATQEEIWTREIHLLTLTVSSPWAQGEWEADQAAP